MRYMLYEMRPMLLSTGFDNTAEAWERGEYINAAVASVARSAAAPGKGVASEKRGKDRAML